MLIHEIYILIFCKLFISVRYFSNPKLVFRNKYVMSLPSFNISFERYHSSKYIFTRDCRSDWPNLLLFKGVGLGNPDIFSSIIFFFNLHHGIIMSKYIFWQSFKKFHLVVFSIAHPKYSNFGGIPDARWYY